MPKMTLLAITQDILSDMNSDEVNSINDTPESLQVAQIVKTTYFEIIDGGEWPHLRRIMPLDALGDLTHPNYMKLPADVNKIYTIKYDCKKVTSTYSEYKTITYLEPLDFLDYVMQRKSNDSRVDTITDFSGVDLFIMNDVAPTYYTSFDDEYIVFDSYDSAIDTTLQASKSQIYVKRVPTWTHDDSFYPDLPPESFSLLVAEAKSTCFNAIKQMPNQKEEQKAIRQRRKISPKKSRVADEFTFKSYGRK